MVTESQIAAISTAPRITEQMVKDNIKEVYYFNGADATGHPVEGHDQLSCMTFCIIILQNGFTITGQSACASLANYNKAIGEELAYRNAFSDIWKFMAYELRTQLSQTQEKE